MVKVYSPETTDDTIPAAPCWGSYCCGLLHCSLLQLNTELFVELLGKMKKYPRKPRKIELAISLVFKFLMA
jgi:hypothetical protein